MRIAAPSIAGGVDGRRDADRASTWPSPTRSRRRSSRSARSIGSSWPRSSATRTRSASTTSRRRPGSSTLKLVGYTEVVHALAPRLTDDASILLFGGQALRRPYPGSTTVTTVNGGVDGARPHARGAARADPRQRASTRVSSATRPNGRASRRRRCRAPGRRSDGSSRWTRSSTRRSSCSRTAP